MYEIEKEPDNAVRAPTRLNQEYYCIQMASLNYTAKKACFLKKKENENIKQFNNW